MQHETHPAFAAALAAGSRRRRAARSSASARRGRRRRRLPPFSGLQRHGDRLRPVKIEIYEPTIPIPATPQLELDLGYTKVEADSGSSPGRASFLWPGDAVGEGLKTFVEQLGLPPELGENGYPVQVNSHTGPPVRREQADEPFPGTVDAHQRDGDEDGVAQTGFSHRRRGRRRHRDGRPGRGRRRPACRPADASPALPGSPTGPASTQFGQAITGGSSATAAADASPADDPAAGGVPGLPPEVAALVDVEGYTSLQPERRDRRQGRHDLAVRPRRRLACSAAWSRSSGIVSTSTSTSDGKKGTTTGRADYGE